MIIDTDFATHWKTELLAELLGDANAGMYLIRLWTHCQIRKCWDLAGDPEQLKGICRYKGEGVELKEALLLAKFLDPLNGSGRLLVHDWQEYNSQLVASWTNGKRGGRKPRPNPEGTQRNPDRTQREPSGNPD